MPNTLLVHQALGLPVENNNPRTPQNTHRLYHEITTEWETMTLQICNRRSYRMHTNSKKNGMVNEGATNVAPTLTLS